MYTYMYTYSLNLPYISCIVKVAAIGGRSAAVLQPWLIVTSCGAHGAELWMGMPSW